MPQFNIKVPQSNIKVPQSNIKVPQSNIKVSQFNIKVCRFFWKVQDYNINKIKSIVNPGKKQYGLNNPNFIVKKIIPVE